MLTVRIEGVEELKRTLSDIGQKQLPFATALAITRTAKSVEQRLLADMSSAFKPASPYVAHSTFSTAATKQNLTATIGLKDIKPVSGTAPSVLLKEHFSGGLRGNKPFEKAITSLGGLPTGWRAIPGSGIKLDAYGNPSRREIGEMLGALRSHLQIYKGRGKRLTLTVFFVVPVGAQSNLPPGIYKRLDRTIKAMFIFVQSARYRKVIDFERSAAQVVAREFQPAFDAAFRDAIRSAR